MLPRSVYVSYQLKHINLVNKEGTKTEQEASHVRLEFKKG